MSQPAPQRIGDYELLRELGHGGMGKVYQVRNVLTDRIEAMKLLLPDLAGRSEFVARFMREIKTLAGLDHPNIAALRTAFTAGDQFAMIMEYVDGVTLADRLQAGPLSTADALNYTNQVLSALTYAHGKHIIHRDIKPGNMMLTPQGVVKLMDFGLARSADEVGLTMTGATLGSLDYASPEQVQSMTTDERSDLYSVGVSLYQMVTGQRMFSVTSSFSIMQAQVKEIPRQPMEIVTTIPKALNDVIMKAVAKDPAQRFQSADEFRDAVSRVTAPSLTSDVSAVAPAPAFDPGFTPPPRPASQGNRSLLLLVGVILVAALVAGDAVYKSHVQHKTDNSGLDSTRITTSQAIINTQGAETAAAMADSQPAQSAATAASSSATSASTTVASATPPPATAAGKRKSQVGAENLPTGPTAEEIQAQQQALLEQKRMLDALETELDHLDGRAASVESSLNALEQQMQHDGLGLRGDMVASRANMRNDFAKAKQSVDAGDTERARHYLDLATREVEKLETFLGHR